MAGSKEEEEESKRQTVSVTSGTQEEKISVGLTPKRVSVSVAIPSNYFEKIWHERNPVEADAEPQSPEPAQLDQIRTEETTKIRRLVANLLPPAEGIEDRTQLVEVMPFQGFAPEEIPGPTLGDKAMGWLAEYWSTLGMLLVAGFSLVMLRSMISASPPERSTPRLLSMENDTVETDAAAAVANRLARFNTTGRSLRDELSELVQEDPDAAANILKSWIGQAG
jgi:flagellar M-ring protein FliF